MRQNYKKTLAAMVLGVSVLGLTACGSTATAADEITYDQSYLQSVADFLVANWDGMTDEQIDTYATMDAEDAQDLLDGYSLPFTPEAFTTAFSGYEGNEEELGAYVSTDAYEVSVDKDEITLVTHLTYENRTADLSIVFNKKSVAQSVTLDPNYSLGEILEKALMNTILGMGTVFSVLIFISLIIYCFNFIPAIQKKFSKKKEDEKAAAPAPAAAPAKEAAQPAAVEEETVDEGELVAAITAAICAYTGSSSDGFVVRSIRRADSAKWKRA